MPPDLNSLRVAYEKTSFRADVPRCGRIEIRIGAANRKLDRLLERAGVETWAYVTAFNPSSRKLDDQENDQRHKKLMDDIKSGGWSAYEGDGVPDDCDWQSERSALILGISQQRAIDLGRAFGQLAIVTGRKGGRPELCWCNEDTNT